MTLRPRPETKFEKLGIQVYTLPTPEDAEAGFPTKRAIDWGALSFFLGILSFLYPFRSYFLKRLHRPSKVQLTLFSFSSIWLIVTRLASQLPVFSNAFVLVSFETLSVFLIFVLPSTLVTSYLEKKAPHKRVAWQYPRRTPAASIL